MANKGDKIAKKVTEVEQTLESNQIAWSKLAKRLGLIALGLWGFGLGVWERVKDLPEKVNQGQVETVDIDTPGEKSFKVRGGDQPPED